MDVTQYSVSALIIQIIFHFTHSAMEEVRFARATDFDVELSCMCEKIQKRSTYNLTTP